MREKINGLKLCVTILLILEILTGVVLISITAGYHRALGLYLAQTEQVTLIGHLSSIYLLGLELLVCYSVGLILWRFICKSERKMEHTQMLVAWNGFSILIVICGSTSVWFLYCSTQSLEGAAATSLLQGIDFYFSDPEWKLLWDGIQYHNECCGINSYKDWKDAVWMTEEEAKCGAMCESTIMMLIPYVCCKRSVVTCFQNYAPHLTIIPVSYVNSTDINTNGCLPIFNYLTFQLFHLLAGVMLSIFILQILIFIFEITSISKAKKLLFSLRDYSNDSDELPLIVVKYPRNVRCITLTDEENFEDFDEDEDRHCGPKYRALPTEDISVRQEITDTCDRNRTFLH